MRSFTSVNKSYHTWQSWMDDIVISNCRLLDCLHWTQCSQLYWNKNLFHLSDVHLEKKHLLINLNRLHFYKVSLNFKLSILCNWQISVLCRVRLYSVSGWCIDSLHNVLFLESKTLGQVSGGFFFPYHVSPANSW